MTKSVWSCRSRFLLQSNVWKISSVIEAIIACRKKYIYSIITYRYLQILSFLNIWSPNSYILLNQVAKERVSEFFFLVNYLNQWPILLDENLCFSRQKCRLSSIDPAVRYTTDLLEIVVDSSYFLIFHLGFQISLYPGLTRENWNMSHSMNTMSQSSSKQYILFQNRLFLPRKTQYICGISFIFFVLFLFSLENWKKTLLNFYAT